MKRRKIWNVWMAAGIIGTIIFAWVVAFPPALWAQTKPVVWNLPHVAAPTYYLTVNLKSFADKVKEKSKGRMEIRVHPASSLYPGPELIPALIEGRAEIAPVLSGYLVDLLLPMGVLELPFMTSSVEEHRLAAEKLRPFFTDQFAKKGLMLMTIHPWPSQQLYSTKKPIAKVEDWKGTKIRTTGAEQTELVKALGGAPVNVAFGEVYTALQRGVIEAAITSATNAEPMKFFEVTKYINYWFINGFYLEFLGINKKAWDALTPDLRKVVTASLKESRFEEKSWEDGISWDARAKKRVQELGMTVIDVPKSEIEKARKLSRPSWDIWLKRTGADGKQALDLALKALGR
jgi:TRAP-type C4-dicarboxylate transport system substrate-binding protein